MAIGVGNGIIEERSGNFSDESALARTKPGLDRHDDVSITSSGSSSRDNQQRMTLL